MTKLINYSLIFVLLFSCFYIVKNTEVEVYVSKSSENHYSVDRVDFEYKGFRLLGG